MWHCEVGFLPGMNLVSILELLRFWEMLSSARWQLQVTKAVSVGSRIMRINFPRRLSHTSPRFLNTLQVVEVERNRNGHFCAISSQTKIRRRSNQNHLIRCNEMHGNARDETAV